MEIGRLVERERELAALERAIAGGGAVVAAGSFATGRSALAEAAAALARRAGATVLVARGAAPERGFGGGVVRQLADRAGLGHEAIAAALGDQSARMHDAIVAALGDRSICVVVDDLHWADPESLRALEAMVAQPSVAFVGTVDPAFEDERFGAPHERVVLAPLSTRGVAAVLAHAAGTHDVVGGVAARYHAATGGRPGLLHSVIAELDGHPPSVSGLEESLERPPRSIQRLIAARLSTLPAECRRLAAALAVGGEHLARDRRCLARLVALDVLSRDHRFTAEILAPAIEHELPVSERSRLHARAAVAALEAGAPPSRVAGHILHAPRDAVPESGSVLAAAAAEARERGDEHAVIRYLRRMVEESAESDGAALAALGSAELRVGRAPAAARSLTQALQVLTEPEDRFRATAELGDALVLQGRAGEAMGFLREATAAARAAGSDAVHLLEATQALAGWCDIEVFRDLRRTLPLIGSELASPGTAGEHVRLGRLAAEHALHGSAGDARRIARLAAPERLDHLLAHQLRDLALVLADDPALVPADGPAALRAAALFRRGDVAAVSAMTSPVTTYFVEALIEQGRLDEAQAALETVVATGSSLELLRLLALGRLRARQGRHDDALAAFAEYAELERQWQFTEPAHTSWRTEAAIVHHLLGDAAEARTLTEQALERARRHGSERHQGIALRVAARTGALGPADAVLHEAIELLDRAGAQLESARARADLGSVLRQGRPRDARDSLRAAEEQALALGATPLVRFAAQELELAGAGTRARGDRDDLTPAERRTTSLAADGLTNREIAATLGISEKTVALQLSRAYRKLGITSRRDLKR